MAPFAFALDGGAFGVACVFDGVRGGVAHSVVVHDAHGCTATAQVLVPATPSFTAQLAEQVSRQCASRLVAQVLTGGAAPFSFVLVASPSDTVVQRGGSGAFDNVAPGSYRVVVTDGQGRSTTTNTIVVYQKRCEFGALDGGDRC